MLRTLSLYAAVGIALLGATVAAADVLVTTDEELLAEFVEALGDGDHRIDAALAYTDTGLEPVELTANGQSELYGEGDSVSLAERAHETLGALDGSDARLVQEHIEILRDDAARIAVRVATSDGYLNVLFDLRQHGERWLVSRVRVT